MAGPWEQYGSATTQEPDEEKGPWQQYAPSAPSEQPPEQFISAAPPISVGQRLSELLEPTQPASALQVHGEAGRSLLGTTEQIPLTGERTPLEYGKELVNVGNLTMAGLTSPEAITSLPLFAIPGVPEAFGAHILSKIPEQYGQIRDTIKNEGLSPKAVGQIVGAGLQDVLGVLGIKQAPRTLRAFKQARLTDQIFPQERAATAAPEAATATPATDAVIAQPERTVIPSATQERQIAEGREPEYTGDVTRGPSKEAGDRGLVGTAAPQQAQEVTTVPPGQQLQQAPAPKLLPGETQGDLISSTQTEPLRLVGEEAPAMPPVLTPEELKAQQLEEARLKSEYQQELMQGLEEHQVRGGQEFFDALEQAGGLPAMSSINQKWAGELQNVREEYQSPMRAEKIAYNKIFKRDAPDPDVVAQRMRAAGFDVTTDTDLLAMAQERLRSGKPIYGSEARGQAFGEEGTSYGELGIANKDTGTKVLNAIKTAAQTLQSMLSNRPSAELEPPRLNIANGGVRPPPPNSVFAPNTPPGADPVPIYAMRVTNVFKRWWERFWPRTLAVRNVKPDSPVITEHQRLIKSDIDYMQKFSTETWWKALRSRSNNEIIDVEDAAVKDYRAQIERGVERDEAYQSAVSRSPQWFQDIVRYRQSRVPIEIKAAETLGVEPPGYTGDPYIARLTNEEGKDVVDVSPKISNVAKAIRTTIGSFDNSRLHPTMKDGIAVGTQYDPVAKAVWLRELTSIRLESTANLLSALKDGAVLFDNPKDALAASPKGRISQVRGIGPNTYYARTPEEAVFLEQNISTAPKNPFGRIQQLANTYVRNPSLINPLPHVTKNMFFKYALARVGNFTFKADAADFLKATPSELRARFDQVMPFAETAERMPQLTAREVGTWAEKTMTRGLKINDPSSQFIFMKADPAMRYALWKSYVKKGMGDQEAANHVWLDLIRYDENSGGMNFWKSIPFNFFVPWRTGTYVTLAKQFMSHPYRTILFIGAVEYLREIRYRASGRWTHLPVDYIDAPLAEAIQNHDPKTTLATAGTTLVFGPGGGQAPSSIKDTMEIFQGAHDPQSKARVMNMFWGLSQLYNIPREWDAFTEDQKPDHLVNILTAAALAEHSALKYEPRRLMKWLPEWMPGMQKAELVKEAEALQAKVKEKFEKGKATYEARHGVSATFERTPEEQQMEELKRAVGQRTESDTTGAYRRERRRR